MGIRAFSSQDCAAGEIRRVSNGRVVNANVSRFGDIEPKCRRAFVRNKVADTISRRIMASRLKIGMQCMRDRMVVAAYADATDVQLGNGLP